MQSSRWHEGPKVSVGVIRHPRYLTGRDASLAGGIYCHRPLQPVRGGIAIRELQAHGGIFQYPSVAGIPPHLLQPELAGSLVAFAVIRVQEEAPGIMPSVQIDAGMVLDGPENDAQPIRLSILPALHIEIEEPFDNGAIVSTPDGDVTSFSAT